MALRCSMKCFTPLKYIKSNPYIPPCSTSHRHRNFVLRRSTTTTSLYSQPTANTWRKHIREFSTTDLMVGGLISTNIIVFRLWKVTNHEFMLNHFNVCLNNILAGRIHTIVTCAFSHKKFQHFVINLFGIFAFGRRVGLRFGPQVLFQMYLGGGIGGSAFFLIRQAFLVKFSKEFDRQHNPTTAGALGASGALMAIMAFDLFSSVAAGIRSLELINDVPFVLLELIGVGYQIVMIVQGKGKGSHFGHLGGATFGIIGYFVFL